MAGARKKHVSVKFSGDDDVINHIVRIDDESCDRGPRKSRKARTNSAVKQKTSVSDAAASSEDETSPPLFGPLEDENVQLHGTDLFHFKTAKKSDQMAQKANEARTPKQKRNETMPHGTPKSAKKVSVKQAKVSRAGGIPKTPTRTGQNKRGFSVKRIEATTPFRLRKRNQLSDGESSDESVESTDDEEEVDNDGDHDNTSKPPPPPTAKVPPTPTSTRKPGTRRRAPEIDMPNMVDGYFDLHSCGVGPTSDRTLAKLGMPKMDQSKLSKMLSSVLTSHQTECKSLVEQHQELFNQWMFHLCNSFNLLLYGLGSKRSLVEEFRETMLHDFTHLVINGYFPSLTIKQVLNSITEDILEHSANFRNPLDQLDFIKEQYAVGDYQDVYIIIHNIDGAMLRGDKTQNVISFLSQVRGFHVIASIDHINSPLIWDKMKCSRFNWLWYDVTTYIPYKEETSYENSLLVQQSGALALSSLTHVLRSLTLNARRIFLLLAHYQLENKSDNASYIGMSFRDMYQRCRENFLVNSDLTLRTQLIEFRDHKMITSKQGHDGMEYLVIPVEMATLTEFLESQEELLTQD